MQRSFICLIIGLLPLLHSCDPDRIFEENRHIPARSWHKDRIMQFLVNMNDTVNSYDIYLNVRNSNRYKNSNLFLFVTTMAPNGYSIRDTVECILADERGKWYGSGLGDIYSLRFPYKKNVVFPYTGTFTFEIQHAMRTNELKEILDLGLRIEKAKP